MTTPTRVSGFPARTLALAAALVLTVASGGTSARAMPGEVRVDTSITSHAATFYDAGGTRPALFGYTGETTATTDLPATAAADMMGKAVRLPRATLAPSARDDAGLRWIVAGRGAPAKINAQDSLPLFVITPARANPFGTSWFQRQETARDLWHWGGLLAGSQISGTERSENAVVGIGPVPASYPARAPGTAGGHLEWEDRHIVRTADSTDTDPVTGASFTGRFAVNIAVPSLRVVGGDGAFTTDTQAPTLTLPLPVRPSGLTIFTDPPAPPGVRISWSRTLNFNARTLTVRATVLAGSVWPSSGVDADDPTLRTWEWTPTVIFPGWDYGSAVNGGPVAHVKPGLVAALRPASLRSDGALEIAHALRSDGLPDLPRGLLDLNLPDGANIETAWGDRAAMGAVRAPGPVLPMARGASTVTGDVEPVQHDGVPALEVRDGQTELGELSVPAVRIDGETYRLDAAAMLDTWTESSGGQDAAVVAMFEVGGVFLDVLLIVDLDGSLPHAAYYLYDGHSTDGAAHEVRLQTTFDPAIGGGGGDTFVEPIHTGSAYPSEVAVPQGFLDLPASFTTGWIGSVPAVEARDADGTIRHLQLYPNQPNSSVGAIETMGYLMVDHGDLITDPDAAIADGEPMVATDITFAVVNGYRGMLWDRSLVPWISYFLVNP